MSLIHRHLCPMFVCLCTRNVVHKVTLWGPQELFSGDRHSISKRKALFSSPFAGGQSPLSSMGDSLLLLLSLSFHCSFFAFFARLTCENLLAPILPLSVLDSRFFPLFRTIEWDWFVVLCPASTTFCKNWGPAIKSLASWAHCTTVVSSTTDFKATHQSLVISFHQTWVTSCTLPPLFLLHFLSESLIS